MTETAATDNEIYDPRVYPGKPQSDEDPSASDSPSHFRFYDNRQKYLLFVNTCSEKWAVADRVGREFSHLEVRPPALRLFDAGMGDGTVLTRVMRHLHNAFPTVPFYVVGKEISLEDVRLTLEKLPDRFNEHPATVVAITNMFYREATSLTPVTSAARARLNWREIPLTGTTAHDFAAQITELESEIAGDWQVRTSSRSGNPLYVRPSVLVLYRDDHRLLLDSIIPRPDHALRDFDLVIASQPYRARSSLDLKVKRVLAPLARSLAPGGRMLTIHSHGNDPGIEIIREVWPEENPFLHNRHALLDTMKELLADDEPDLSFPNVPDNRALFRYVMHTLPTEVGASIGTSTLMAAWNAAVYVAQIEDARLEHAMEDGRYLDATRNVLRANNGLWFWDEAFVVSRRA